MRPLKCGAQCPRLGRIRTAVPLMTYALALLAGIVGAGLGFALGATAAGLLAPVLGISGFEGASGYLLSSSGADRRPPRSRPWRLARSSSRRASKLGCNWGRLALVVIGVIGVGGAVLGGFWFMRPIINANGPALTSYSRSGCRCVPHRLAGPAIRSSFRPARTGCQADWSPQEEEGRAVIAGSVEMYFRTWQRMLVLTMPDKTDVLFNKAWAKPPPIPRHLAHGSEPTT